ncbi:hypothetical protein PtA15_5A663 [Puccinia triticina]|uniref:Uncharacterized protein n=1 Tax=Puccinia triticina TaxID=208348 RepID=A0ABY7CKA9_9BASI|nr:uncharacterized protein PtA15_5A663 [Puccinia triticina]WAQ85089.1 hypothetical protein PtA15_5A663 [Puccinia triticina]WAR58422.1 hypothetical protein PtB15_5B656 [Puccinia triticina]
MLSRAAFLPLLCLLLAARLRADQPLGGCSTVTPGRELDCLQANNDPLFNTCKVCKKEDVLHCINARSAAKCNYPALFGSSCATVAPGTNLACLKSRKDPLFDTCKVCKQDDVVDCINTRSAAKCNYPAPLGSSCATVAPGTNLACLESRKDPLFDTCKVCKQDDVVDCINTRSAANCNYPAPLGSSCATVAPGTNLACLKSRKDPLFDTCKVCKQDDVVDCINTRSATKCYYPAPLGSSCATVTPGTNLACLKSRKDPLFDTCKVCKQDDVVDCINTRSAAKCNYPAPLGSSCATVAPGTNLACLESRKDPLFDTCKVCKQDDVVDCINTRSAAKCNYPAPLGSSCATVAPGTNLACLKSRKDPLFDTCKVCKQDDVVDCINTRSAAKCNYPAPLGSSCATVAPGTNLACLESRKDPLFDTCKVCKQDDVVDCIYTRSAAKCKYP